MIEVNEKNFKEEVLDNERVLIDFNATWCGPCRMLKPVLSEFSESSKIKVCSCDVDNNEKLAMEYHVSSIPCLIIMEKGVEVKRNVGYMNIDQLKEFVGE